MSVCTCSDALGAAIKAYCTAVTEPTEGRIRAHNSAYVAYKEAKHQCPIHKGEPY